VSRNVAALETAVISVGHITAGAPESLNVMPSELVVGGTMRAFNAETQALLERRMTELAHLCAQAQGTTAAVALRWGTVPMINAEREADVSAAAAKGVAGVAAVDEAVTPITGGEDFAFMVQRKPGALIFLGNGAGADAHALHTPKYNFNDAALPF